MAKSTILLIAVITALSALAGSSRESAVAGPQPYAGQQSPDQSAMHLAIATVDPMLEPTDRYSVGAQVIVTIRMTNTSSQPDYVCVSSDLYQDLPTLTKDGRLLPYTKWQTNLLRDVQKDQTCRHDDLPEMVLLKANDPTVVDFLTIVDDSRLPTGALSWYEPLTPGIYQLTIQRRLGCCDGAIIESNKISFAVVQ
jgi:hypothetical protein